MAHYTVNFDSLTKQRSNYLQSGLLPVEYLVNLAGKERCSLAGLERLKE